MRSLKSLFALTGLLAALSTSLAAGEVKMAGVHLCCGQCVKDLEAAMKDAEGISGLTVDKDGGTVTFQAADEKAAKAGVEKIAGAGFGGEAKHGDERVPLPNPGFEKDDRDKSAETVTFKGVHLCCQGCIDAVDEAMKEIKGVESVAVDKEAKTVKLTGKGIRLRQAYRTLTKAGFYGKIEK